MQKKDPWIVRLLASILPNGFDEGIIGDLLEEHERQLKENGSFRSKLALIWSAIRFTHPYLLLKKLTGSQKFSSALFFHQWQLSIRIIKKQKLVSSINIFGLSLSTAFIILTFFYIRFEKQFDQFHKNKDHIWRVYQTNLNPETGQKIRESAITSIPLGQDLNDEIPQIIRHSRIGSGSGNIILNNTFYSQVYTYVDSTFLTMFDFPLLYGDRSTALRDPNSIVLSQDLANRYFNKSNVIGEVVQCQIGDQIMHATVSGIIDPKKNQSSIQFDALLPFDNYLLSTSEAVFTSYEYGIVENYIQTQENIDRLALENSISMSGRKSFTDQKEEVKLGLQSLSEIHINNKIVGNAAFIDPSRIYILLVLALMVLVITNINFINLSLSQILDRWDEMALRKALGASDGGIRNQLILESVTIAAIALVVGLGIVYLSLPYLSSILDLPIDIHFDTYTVLFLASILLTTGLSAGMGQTKIIQSSLLTRSGNPAGRSKQSDNFLKNGLIVIQFAFSLFLIMGTYVLHHQIEFIQEKELGYDSEFLIEISLGETQNKEESHRLISRFKNKLGNHPEISSISASMNNHREPWTKLTFEQVDGSNRSVYFNQVDADYLTTLNLSLVEGRGFKTDTMTLDRYVVVNEAFLEYFGWSSIEGRRIPGKTMVPDHEIIGVVRDFHYMSLHHKIEPLILALDDQAIKSGISGLSTYVWPPNLYQIILKVNDHSPASAIELLQGEWKSLFPDRPFNYSLVDETIEARYRDEKRWSSIVQIGSFFAITIAWLGLISLLRFSLRKRLKEIGVRKVLGATPENILVLLSKKFLTLVILSCLIAMPISVWLSKKWLSGFAYRVHISITEFSLLLISIISFTLVLIYLETVSATKRNPAVLLHQE